MAYYLLPTTLLIPSPMWSAIASDFWKAHVLGHVSALDGRPTLKSPSSACLLDFRGLFAGSISRCETLGESRDEGWSEFVLSGEPPSANPKTALMLPRVDHDGHVRGEHAGGAWETPLAALEDKAAEAR
jgi:hypothetical protein